MSFGARKKINSRHTPENCWLRPFFFLNKISKNHTDPIFSIGEIELPFAVRKIQKSSELEM